MLDLRESLLVCNVRLGHALGWSFTQLVGKRPILKAWQNHPRESLEQALVWAAQGNVGLRTGRISGVVVIDVDKGGCVDAQDLPPTVMVKTGGNGIHLYFSCGLEVGNSAGRLGPHVDVKAEGGQVVFPGSVHPKTKKVYEWAPDRSPEQIQLAPLPQHIINLLQRSAPLPVEVAPRTPSAPPHRRLSRGRYAEEVLVQALDVLRRAPEGTRNNTLNKTAFRLRWWIAKGILDRADVERALFHVALEIGLGSAEITATIRSGLDTGQGHFRHPYPDATAHREVGPANRPFACLRRRQSGGE